MANSKTTEHKEGQATVRIVYFTSKTLADGSHPLLVCITKDRKRKYIATGLALLPKYWNAEKSNYRDAVRKSYPEPQREKLVVKLAEWEAKYKGAAHTLADADEQHNAQAVASKAIEGRKAQRRVKLLAYCDELSAGYLKTGQTGNATIYRDLRNQLAKFITAEHGQQDMPFERVNLAFCDEWEQTLRATGAKEITLSLRFRTLRAVLNKAIAAGLAKSEHYPFSRTEAESHKFQVGKFNVNTKKRCLSREDVRRIESLLPTTERHQRAKEIFVFSFYVSGMSYVDLAMLRWGDLSGQHAETGHPERVSYKREKTKRKKSGQELNVKLLAPAAAIVAAYRPLTHNGPESYVFPILNAAKHVTPMQVKNRLHKVLGQVNKDLKELAELAGIESDKPLTTYVARHSFATAMKMSGAATGVISQAMGHSSEAVTAVYLDSFDSKTIDNAAEGIL
jgi:integrase